MANRERGEVAIEIDGQTYTLRLDLNALAEFEAALSTPIQQVTFQEGLQRVERGQLIAVRAILWAGLRRYHPKLSLMEAGDLIVKLGGMQNLDTVLKEAVASAMPAPDAPAQPNPQQARRSGRGRSFSSEPAVPGSAELPSGH
jgi:hypothetical protein